MSIHQITPHNTDLERLSDVMKLSAHVTRLLGQNPGLMTLQGTNSYLLQPPSNSMAPLILIDTSSPHTAEQYVDLITTHLFHLGLESGTRETHFESPYAEQSLKYIPEDRQDELKAKIVGTRADDPYMNSLLLTEYGPDGRWSSNSTKERRFPAIEHIILTHRHLDHVGALPLLLTTLKEHGCPQPKIWKFPSPDEAELAASDRDRPTCDSALLAALPQGAYHAFSPFQPFHPIMPGLMISIIDPVYRHLLKHDKDGKPKWNEVPEIARVSVRCLRTPGHTADSVSLVMCEGEKGVFTGDTVLGQGTTVFTDLTSYMTSLKTLLALKPRVLYPAHGPHIATQEECTAYLSDYIAHRQEREDQIVNLLQQIAADPAVLGMAIVELFHKLRLEQAAEIKYKHEFLSGKPYHPPKNADKGKKGGEGENKDGKENKAEAEVGDKEKKDGKENKEEGKEGQEDKEEKTKGQGPRKQDGARVDLGSKTGDHHAIQDRFPKDQKGITVSLICRILYKTDKEGIIYAATRSVDAHLVKLEGEGKVRRLKVRLPKVVEGKLGKAEEQDGWEWASEVQPEELEAKLKQE